MKTKDIQTGTEYAVYVGIRMPTGKGLAQHSASDVAHVLVKATDAPRNPARPARYYHHDKEARPIEVQILNPPSPPKGLGALAGGEPGEVKTVASRRVLATWTDYQAAIDEAKAGRERHRAEQAEKATKEKALANRLLALQRKLGLTKIDKGWGDNPNMEVGQLVPCAARHSEYNLATRDIQMSTIIEVLERLEAAEEMANMNMP